MADRDSSVAGDRKSAQKLKAQITKLERSVIAIEAEHDKLKNVRDEVINQAKMDRVEIPRVGAESKRRKKRGGKKRAAPIEGDFDYDALSENREIKDEAEYDKIKQAYLDSISEMETSLQKINPNMKAFEQFDEVESRLMNMSEDFKGKREGQEGKLKEFDEILQKRTELFRKIFDHVEKNIDNVYKALTKSSRHPMGGNAYLNLEDPDKPFLSGIKYNAMPPGKRFRDMDQLSGGEKTVAALALLFAIHSCHPAPFFVLDEVDAALDSANVNKVSNYVRSRTQDDSLQCIVISLKDTFYHKADALVGVYKDQEQETSGTLTLSLSEYDSKPHDKKSKDKPLSHSAVFGSQNNEKGKKKTPKKAPVSQASASSSRSKRSSRKRTRGS
uniref:RecF/RecN/SMC N-terminal domain-containing protein n=1 Tax=Lotharella globosa TaxID=91324 RepID=A0A7S4E0N4_9EUKA|mmetsp:Transcript_26601/g.51980  ORF Transcript_26601/g.51980 Transcript_26601/m.51980 type:complete len:387 (+) Transcript_26601:968-2128(+)